jgi:hypothetical protein
MMIPERASMLRYTYIGCIALLPHDDRDKCTLRNTAMSQVLSVVTKTFTAFPPCRSVDKHQRFRGICCLSLQDKLFYPEDGNLFTSLTWRYTPEDSYFAGTIGMTLCLTANYESPSLSDKFRAFVQQLVLTAPKTICLSLVMDPACWYKMGKGTWPEKSWWPQVHSVL